MNQTQTEAREERKALPMTKAEPQEQHRWLHQLVGEWTFETDASAPGQPASKTTGTESVRSIGGIWVQAEGRGEMPGAGLATSVMTLGYDPQKKRFVGTWIGSMMTHLWVYNGELDASERILTLNSEGPSMADDGTMSRYQDVIEFKTNDHRTLTARVLEADGKWKQFMTVEYRRTK
jgi:uncharacterized protein DUF1579